MIIVNMLFGLITGFIFGYILSRTGITKYPRVMGMLLLKDFKILKFMLTAVTSSMILFYLLGDIGLLKITLKNLEWGKFIGGLIFGTGMGLLGYCPGTMLARIGEGKIEPVFAVFGMVLGIFFYALTFKPVKEYLLTPEISGDISILLGINQWFIIIPAVLLFIAVIYFVNKLADDNRKIF